MALIDVRTVGHIRTRRLPMSLRSEPEPRAYTRVTFIRNDSTVDVTYTVGSPVLYLGASLPTLYDTVCAALSFLDSEESGSADDWLVCTAVPIGTAIVTRHAYSVIDDGNGGSDATDGKIRRSRVRLDRYHDETAADAVSRCLVDSGAWEDAGTLDCSGDPTHRETRWYTVPIEGSEDARGIPCVGHTIEFSGDVTRWLPEIREGFKVAGLSW
jgi:hypothetical protein